MKNLSEILKENRVHFEDTLQGDLRIFLNPSDEHFQPFYDAVHQAVISQLDPLVQKPSPSEQTCKTWKKTISLVNQASNLSDFTKNLTKIEAQLVGSIHLAKVINENLYRVTVDKLSDYRDLENQLREAESTGLDAAVTSLKTQMKTIEDNFDEDAETVKYVDQNFIDACINQCIYEYECVGTEPALRGLPMYPHHADNIAKKVWFLSEIVNAPHLNRVAKALGKLEAVLGAFRTAQIKKSPRKNKGLTYSNDLSSLYVDEWAKDDTQFQVDFVESKLACYKTGISKAGFGPIVVMQDLSGSMAGSPYEGIVRHEWSMAIMALLIKLAKTQKRKIYWIGFNGIYVEKDLSRFRDNDLMYVLTRRPDGGTRFLDPLNRAMNIIDSGGRNSSGIFKKSDILIISDGDPNDIEPDHIHFNRLNYIKKWQQKHKVVIQGMYVAGDSYVPYVFEWLCDNRMITLKDALLNGKIADLVNGVETNDNI